MTFLRRLLLEKIRLSLYLFIFLDIFLAIKLYAPELSLERGVLTLFSVNSFLYGFYIAPILSGQKARIDELHKVVRNEANALFSMLLDTQKLSEKTKTALQDKFKQYAHSIVRDKRVGQGEAEYEAIISYCLDYRGRDKAEVMKILDKVVANQANRTQFNLHFRNSVYSNEWIIMGILFTITLGFILILSTEGVLFFKLMAAFLCTGLTMLIIILIKLSTLTHKRARQIWAPIETLIATKFHRFD